MRRNTRFFWRVGPVATTAMLLVVPAAAQATPITYRFSGTTTFIAGPDGGANVPGNTPFSGSFTYDSQLPLIDANTTSPGASDPTTNNFGYLDLARPGPLNALNAKVNFGGLLSFATTDPTNRIAIVSNDKMNWNSPPTPTDDFSIHIAQKNGDWLGIDLSDPTGQALTSTALPMTLDLARFGQDTIEFESANGLVAGNITSLDAVGVPEPSTVAILALGGVGLVIARRKAQSRCSVG